jgi:hypothetical protein
MAYSPCDGINWEFNDVAEEISKLRGLKAVSLMINWLHPGLEIVKHIDHVEPTTLQPNDPHIERWHLPVITNPGCYWWDANGGEVHQPEMIWFGPVKYWELHAVGNRGEGNRIHIVVDLDVAC